MNKSKIKKSCSLNKKRENILEAKIIHPNDSNTFPKGRFHIVIMFIALRVNIVKKRNGGDLIIDGVNEREKLMNVKIFFYHPHKMWSVGHDVKGRKFIQNQFVFYSNSNLYLFLLHSLVTSFTVNHTHWKYRSSLLPIHRSEENLKKRRKNSRVLYCIHYCALTSRRES